MFTQASYRILQRLPDGEYLCVGETEDIEDAKFRWMLLEAEYPGCYAVYNTFSGKRVESLPAMAYSPN